MDSTSLDPPEFPEQDTIEASFALLELCLEQLSTFAPVERPEQILDLIPDVPLTAKQLIVVELIKFDLAMAAQHASHEDSLAADGAEVTKRAPRSLEFYWPAVGEILPQEAIPFDLVLEEVQLRRAAGDRPRWDDYRQRFPDLADTIGKWLAGGETNVDTHGAGRVPELPIDAIVDDFHVLKQLGQGAFARVYLAKQVSMHRLVALKATSRGSEEPQALSQLDHPNIVRVYDQREIANCGVAQTPAILLYMQYLAGGTLADCIKQVRSLPSETWRGKHILESIDKNLMGANQSIPEQSGIRSQLAAMEWPEVVAWMGIQLADGLGYAAEKGVLHRDVKPANILLNSEAVPKLADFNVSCSGLSGRAGAAAYFGGSLAYMSPEQLQVADPTDPMAADQLDGRSDLYALGIVLWELWQGKRPWMLTGLASNWTEAVIHQRRVRAEPFSAAIPASTPTERVLEKVLRSLLQIDPEMRPQSGKETAARLRLALHPELAVRFEPPPKSIAGRLLSLPVLLLAVIVIFGPNTAASRFNYEYNLGRMQEMDKSVAGIEDDFKLVSWWVNAIVYPTGAILFLWIMLPIAHIIHRSRLGASASDREVSDLWNIGNKATLICGILWTISGIVFAVVFSSMHEEFGSWDAFHFFFSLVLCGGVAWIYPYFGMTLLAVLLYYPKIIAPSMQDSLYARRCARVHRHIRWYLLSALAIPLTAIASLLFRGGNLEKGLILAGIIVTAIGLLASFFAYQKLEETMEQFKLVLGSEEPSRTV